MKKLLVIGVFVFAIFSLALNIYLGYRLMTVPKIIPAQDKTAEIMAAVGKLAELPPGKTPTIATVEDPEYLKKQGLFPTALKGDIVLVYTEEKKAILYRPSTNKIIEISVVNITQEPATQPATTPTPAPTPEPETTPSSPMNGGESALSTTPTTTP